jgi:hypothetical protein
MGVLGTPSVAARTEGCLKLRGEDPGETGGAFIGPSQTVDGCAGAGSPKMRSSASVHSGGIAAITGADIDIQL